MTEFEPPVDATFSSGEQRRLTDARHVRLDNSRMRAVPRHERLLTVLCECERAGRPSIFAVVTRGNGLTRLLIGENYAVTREAVQPPDSPLGYLCTGGRRHRVSLDAVWDAVDRLRDLRLKVIDVESVAPPRVS